METNENASPSSVEAGALLMGGNPASRTARRVFCVTAGCVAVNAKEAGATHHSPNLIVDPRLHLFIGFVLRRSADSAEQSEISARAPLREAGRFYVDSGSGLVDCAFSSRDSVRMDERRRGTYD